MKLQTYYLNVSTENLNHTKKLLQLLKIKFIYYQYFYVTYLFEIVATNEQMHELKQLLI
jgi:hypothetical protein